MALALLQGPHGGEVLAVLLGSWDVERGPPMIEALRSGRPDLPVIVLSHGDTVSVAVEAMRAGASDFLVRPVAPERLLEALAANADRRRAAGELAPLSEKLAPPLALEQLIGGAPEFRSALAIAAKSARNRLPVLIIGEPGTGKETVARAIHGASLRAKGPLLEARLQGGGERTSSTANCLVTRRAPSRAPSPRRPARSSRPTAARWSSMRSACFPN